MALTAEVQGSLLVHDPAIGETELSIQLKPFFKTVTHHVRGKTLGVGAASYTIDTTGFTTISSIWIRCSRECTLNLIGTTDTILAFKEIMLFSTVTVPVVNHLAGPDTLIEWVMAGT